MAKPHSDRLSPYRPSSETPWDPRAAAHLLERAGFGGSQKDISALAALPYERAIQTVLDAKAPFQTEAPDWISEANAERAMDRSKLTQEQRQELRRTNGERLGELRAWWVDRMLRSPNGLEEKMVLFWHSHFATSAEKIHETVWLYEQLELFRQYGRGRFPELVNRVARDPAMIRLLDSESNRKGHPNENFARELMELYTLSEGHYSETDVVEAARAFTGYGLSKGRYHFHEGRHDAGTKTVLGRTGTLRGEDVVDAIMSTEAAQTYLPTKLFAYFVYPNPPATIRAQLRKVFVDSGFDVGAVLSAIFRSEAFFSGRARGALVKGPAQYVVGSLRKLDIPLPPAQAYVAMKRMGQDILWPPNVDGWEEGQTWINTNSLMMRYHFGYYLSTGVVPAGFRLGKGSDTHEGPWIDVRALVSATHNKNPGAAIDQIAALLLSTPLSSAKRREYIDFLGRASNGARVQFNLINPTSRERMRAAIYLILSSPDYQLA